METLKKTSLFWDVEQPDPKKHGKFIAERIFAFGDEDDFKWALAFYGAKKLKDNLLKIKSLDKKSLSFWCQYFNINPSKCIQKQSATKQIRFWKR